MLKITKNIEIGDIFQIRNAWRDSISNLINEKDFPFCFKVIDILHNTNKLGTMYLCESISQEKNEKTQKLIVSSTILQYIFGLEVNDCNVGLYFNDYLPMENSKILTIDNKDKLKIYPLQFCLNVTIEQNIPSISFIFRNLLDNKENSFVSQSKNSWKLLKGVDDYMTDVEKMYQDTFIHKEYVLKVCNVFANYLEEQGQIEDANDLRHRAIIHDNSKILNRDEFRALTSIINDKSCLKDANSHLSSFKQDAIELHWKNNEHHPEHFENINDMPPRARREFVCDCCARSLQYQTDLLSFMETRLQDRFHFNDLIKEEILHNCKVLIDLLNKN